LDGVCVLQGGELDDAVLAEFHVNFAAHEAALLVKETMPFIALGGRSALDAVDFDVLAAADGYGIGRHGVLLWKSVLGSRFSVLSGTGAVFRCFRRG